MLINKGDKVERDSFEWNRDSGTMTKMEVK